MNNENHISNTSVRDCSGVKFLEIEKMKQNRKIGKNLTGAESPTPHHFFLIFLLYTEREDRKNGEGERPKNTKGRSTRKESPIMGGYVQVELSEYDSLGRVSRKSSPFILNKETPLYTTHTYNADNQIVRVDAVDGSYTEITDNGYVSESRRYAGGELVQSQKITENARELVVSRTIQGKTIAYEYNARGDLTEIRDPENGVTTIVYDLQGNKKSHKDGNTGTTTFSYDKEGNLVSKTDALGLTVQYEVDELNRVVKMSYPANGTVAGGVVKYIYDTAPEFGLGRLFKVEDESGVTENYYDIRGNVVKQKKVIDDVTAWMQSEYDPQNRSKKIIYPDGASLQKPTGVKVQACKGNCVKA